MRILIFVLALALSMTSASAAVKQQDIDAYRALVALDKRLATTGYRLAKANAEFCPDKARKPGWVLHTYRQYPDRETARAAFSFPMPIAVAAIVENGPAAKAGIKEGEGLANLPGGIFWSGERIKHKPSSELVDGINVRLRDSFKLEGPLQLEFAAAFPDGVKHRKIMIDPPLVCASDFLISTGSKADAGADGETVRVSAKLAEFTPDENEFAFIVAHELAHNILRHRARLNAANVKRGIGRMFGKSKKMIRKSEVEADQLALWLMANAGYDPEVAPIFIERFGRKYGQGFFADGTHYRWKKRQKLIREELVILRESPKGSYGYHPPLLKELRIIAAAP